MNKKIDPYKEAIAAAFSAAASTYDQAAIVEQEIGTRLINKLAGLPCDPKYILDLGCATGQLTQQLQNTFPNATIIGLDLAYGMVKFAKLKTVANFCCADIDHLPFANKQFDLIFANCSLQYMPNLQQTFTQLQRALSSNGILIFATFGPNTLQQLGLDNKFVDMHIIGDLLLQLQYKNPIMETENLRFNYKQLRTLLNDLAQSGSYNIDVTPISNLDIPFSDYFEIIYGLAWKGAHAQYKDELGNTYIPIDQIKILDD